MDLDMSKLKQRSESRKVVFNSLQPRGILQARILDILFSGGSSQPMDWTQVSHIAGEYFISWAIR